MVFLVKQLLEKEGTLKFYPLQINLSIFFASTTNFKK